MMLDHARKLVHETAAANPPFQRIVRQVAEAVGYDLTHITRKVYWEECSRLIEAMNPPSLNVLEISAGETWKRFQFGSYRSLDYPEHDICNLQVSDDLRGRFDLVIADQVFEHLMWPRRAASNVYSMLKPGGAFLLMTPFMIRVHEVPIDCTRWTRTGIKYFLADSGFPEDHIESYCWGNLDALKANLLTWGRVGWRRRFPNDVRFPVSVWAIARKPAAERPAGAGGRRHQP
jgi:SAM-dependent methyltransferase